VEIASSDPDEDPFDFVVQATGAAPFWRILVAGADGRGTVQPAGPVPVHVGASGSFTIDAEPYAHIVDVATNGAPVGAVTSFT